MTLCVVEVGIRAVLAVVLRIAAHGFALLDGDLVSRFGLSHGDLVLALGSRLARILRLICHIVRIIVGPRIRDILAGIRVVFARVCGRIRKGLARTDMSDAEIRRWLAEI